MSESPSPHVLVLGVGNVLKGDDAVGPYVAERLGAIAGKTISAVDCGTIPENYTSVVRRMRPRSVVIVDAADMGLPPGSVRIIPGGRAGALGLSTHSMPLSLFMDYVSGLTDTVVLIGIQPLSMRLGEEISDSVRQSANALADAIMRGQISKLSQLED